MKGQDIPKGTKDLERAKEILKSLGGEKTHFHRLKALISRGKQLPPLSPKERRQAKLLSSCQERTFLCVWLNGHRLHFRAHSESTFVNGLISLFMEAFDGMNVLEFLELSPDILKKTGLKQLSLPSRSNTAYTLFESIKKRAAELIAETERPRNSSNNRE